MRHRRRVLGPGTDSSLWAIGHVRLPSPAVPPYRRQEGAALAAAGSRDGGAASPCPLSSPPCTPGPAGRGPAHGLTGELSRARCPVTVGGALLAVTLLWAECATYWGRPVQNVEMKVHKQRDNFLPIHINMSLPAMPCGMVNVDVVDQLGSHEANIWSGLHKVPLDRWGNRLEHRKQQVDFKLERQLKNQTLETVGRRLLAEEAKGNATGAGEDGDYEEEEEEEGEEGGGKDPGKPAPLPTRNPINVDDPATMDPLTKFLMVDIHKMNPEGNIKEALEDKEGCLLWGDMHVKRVQGVFKITVLGLRWDILLTVFKDPNNINVTHHIHKLAFGDEFPGQVQPLDGQDRVTLEQQGAFKYYLKAVPTDYIDRWGRVLNTYQYSMNELYVPLDHYHYPEIQFEYDISPIEVEVRQATSSLGHFLTRICAVVGGAFAVTGMIDKFVFWTLNGGLAGVLKGSGGGPKDFRL